VLTICCNISAVGPHVVFFAREILSLKLRVFRNVHGVGGVDNTEGSHSSLPSSTIFMFSSLGGIWVIPSVLNLFIYFYLFQVLQHKPNVFQDYLQGLLLLLLLLVLLLLVVLLLLLLVFSFFYEENLPFLNKN